MKLFYANVRSLRNKIDEVRLLADVKRPHIMLFVESWLHSDINDSEVSVQGYNIFRRDRNCVMKSKGGGVIIYAHNDLNVSELTDSNNFNTECLWLKVLGKYNSVDIGLYYRPPCSNEADDIEMCKSIDKLISENGVLIGDFNYPMINWKLRCSDKVNDIFLKLVDNKFLRQHVKSSTRGDNILDLVFTSDVTLVSDMVIDCPISNSDHNSLVFDVNFIRKPDLNNREGFYDYEKGDYDKINAELSCIAWENLFMQNNSNKNWEVFKNILVHLIKTFVPWKVCSGASSCRAKWMNGRLARLIEIKGKNEKK